QRKIRRRVVGIIGIDIIARSGEIDDIAPGAADLKVADNQRLSVKVAIDCPGEQFAERRRRNLILGQSSLAARRATAGSGISIVKDIGTHDVTSNPFVAIFAGIAVFALDRMQPSSRTKLQVAGACGLTLTRRYWSRFRLHCHLQSYS